MAESDVDDLRELSRRAGRHSFYFRQGSLAAIVLGVAAAATGAMSLGVVAIPLGVIAIALLIVSTWAFTQTDRDQQALVDLLKAERSTSPQNG